MGKAKRRYLEALKRFQRLPDTQRGTLGNALGVVVVPNKSFMVYVTIPGLGVREVINKHVANIPGTPVKVGYDPLEPNIFQVLNTVTYPQTATATTTPYTSSVGTHALTHNWSGNDTVWIEKRQLMPLRVTPLGGMDVFLSRDIYWGGSQWAEFGGQRFNVGNFVPPTGSCYALLYVTPEGGWGALTGTVRDLMTLTVDDIPSPTPGTFPVAAIRFYGGQTGIGEGMNDTDIVDVRGLFSPAPYSSSVSGASGIAVDTTNFNHNLSAADNTVQKALDTLDEITAGVGLTNPMTQKNDIIFGGISGVAQRLGAGSDGQVLTLVSGTMNWENPASGMPIFHGCKVYKQAVQTVANLGNDPVVWDSESYDTDAYHGVSGTTFTVPAGLAGYYHVTLQLDFYDSDYMSSAHDITATITNGSGTALARNTGKTKMFGGAVEVSTDLYLNEGDVIQGYAYQASGGNLDLSYTGNYNYMCMHLIGT